METSGATDRSIIRAAGTGVLLGVVVFTTIVVALHVAQPHYAPARQLISELADAIGGEGMFIAFVALAASCLCAERGLAERRDGTILRLLFGVSAAALFGAGWCRLSVFPIIHVAAVVVAFTALVTAMLLSPLHAGVEGASGSRAISWTLAGLAIAGVGSVGFGAPLGLVQRVSAASILLWLGLVGFDLRRTSEVIKGDGSWTLVASHVVTVFIAAASLSVVIAHGSPIPLIVMAWFVYLTVRVSRRNLGAQQAAAVTFILLGLGVYCVPLNPFAATEGQFVQLDYAGQTIYLVGWLVWSLFLLVLGWRLDAHRVACERS